MSDTAAMFGTSSRPVVTLLTTRTAHPTVRALADGGVDFGLNIRCAPRVDPTSALVFPWGYSRLAALALVRRYCSHRGIEHINATPLSKWEQLMRLAEAGLPIANSRWTNTLFLARDAADILGYPVIIKPNWGARSRGVELIHDDAELASAWTSAHRIVQHYLPEGARCTRILVIGDKAVSSITRVAKDGVHATYDHGRRATLEPYVLQPDRVALAVAACRAIGVDVGGVDLVETASGPRILEVNHIEIEFEDRDLHGPDATGALLAWIAERVRARRAPLVPHEPAKRLRLVAPPTATPGPIRRACEACGLTVDVAPTADPTADATWLWEVSGLQRRRLTSRLRALPLLMVDGNASTSWANRARLFRAGIAVTRARLAYSLDSALGAAEEFGYPLTLRFAGSNRALKVDGEAALRAAWSGRHWRRCAIEPAHYAAAARVRVWIAGDRAFSAARVVHGRCQPMPVRRAPCDLAVAACQTLQISFGIVDVALTDVEPVVLRVQSSGRWLESLSASGIRTALSHVLGPLCDEVKRTRGSGARQSATRLTVAIARDSSGCTGGYRIHNIHALQRELARRGHRMVALRGSPNQRIIADTDLILQDPLHAFGFAKSGDALDAFLYENAAARCHLLRYARRGTADKYAMHALALELGVRSPAIHRHDDVGIEHLPLIAKPRRGSLGIGVRLLRTMKELHGVAGSRRLLLQQFVDSGVSGAVSIRVITVVDQIVAAALFHNPRAVCSNLARGGRAIPLTGPGRRLHLTREERALLDRIGIDAVSREVPLDVVEMAAKIGRHHSKHGAQMLGQDYVVDRLGQWYFLEVNMAFGTAVFNVTDGEGYPSYGRGLVHAGRVLADAIEAQFKRSGASAA